MLIRPSDAPVISTSRLAPLFGGVSSQQMLTLLRDATVYISSPTGFPTTEDVRQLLRQAGVVNLYFFLRWICGYGNAFTRLTPELHLDMCNFYQIVDQPRSMGAAFLPRGHAKSTVFTYGGTLWDIVRDPDWEEILGSNIKDRGVEFNMYIHEVLEANDLFAWLYPEYVPIEGRNLNHNSEMTRVPCKRTYRPNVKVVGVGGSIQGVHAKDRFKMDDLVGEHMLDSLNQLGADNEKARQWFQSAVENIPKGPLARVFAVGTRYGPNDAWTSLWGDITKFYGYTQGEPFEEKPDGLWTVYYRAVREDYGDGRGENPVWPEEYTNEQLDKMRRDKPWQYWTQMMNMSTYSGLSEFIDYQLKDCTLDVNEAGHYIVSYLDTETGDMCSEPLDEMNVVAACDPAGSDKKRSARTSKSAYVIYARNWKDMRFVLSIKSEYAPITTVFGWLFDGFKRFKRYIKTTNVEMQGPFKILKDIIRMEEVKRNEWVNLRGVSAKGDKDTRIRTYLQPLMERGQLYAVESVQSVVWGEMSVFPDGHMKDVLDALAIAEAACRQPRRNEDEDDENEQRHAQMMSGERSVVTGY